MAGTWKESKVEEVLMGGKKWREVAMSIAYVIERHLLHLREVGYEFVVKTTVAR